MTILHIDSSARLEGSTTRSATQALVEELGAEVIRRDLTETLPHITGDWVGANFTPADDRSKAQRDTLALSDTLVDELIAADTIIIGAPIYNFAIPAALKAWVDMIARVGRTFKYTEAGPVGLLEGKSVKIVVASGGTPIGADFDYATPYLRHIMAFIGITDVEILHVDDVTARAAA